MATPKIRKDYAAENAVRREHLINDWDSNGITFNFEIDLVPHRTHSDEAIDRLTELALQFIEEVARLGTREATDRYLSAATSWVERLDRRATIRTLEKITHPDVWATPWPGWLEPSGTRGRHLTPIEVGLVRWAALDNVLRAGAVAALDAGATANELPAISRNTIGWDGDEPAAFALCGTERDNPSGSTICRPRTVPVPLWSRAAVRRLVKQTALPDDPILYTRNPATAFDKQVSAILMHANRALDDAGLKGDGSSKPGSLRITRARQTCLEHGPDAAAAVLGFDDLGRTLEVVGLNRANQWPTQDSARAA